MVEKKPGGGEGGKAKLFSLRPNLSPLSSSAFPGAGRSGSRQTPEVYRSVHGTQYCTHARRALALDKNLYRDVKFEFPFTGYLDRRFIFGPKSAPGILARRSALH